MRDNVGWSSASQHAPQSLSAVPSGIRLAFQSVSDLRRLATRNLFTGKEEEVLGSLDRAVGIVLARLRHLCGHNHVRPSIFRLHPG